MTLPVKEMCHTCGSCFDIIVEVGHWLIIPCPFCYAGLIRRYRVPPVV